MLPLVIGLGTTNTGFWPTTVLFSVAGGELVSSGLKVSFNLCFLFLVMGIEQVLRLWSLSAGKYGSFRF